jgi:hypothetical protein
VIHTAILLSQRVASSLIHSNVIHICKTAVAIWNIYLDLDEVARRMGIVGSSIIMKL